MNREVRIQPITAEAFAPFGDLLEASGKPDRIINQGRCGRYHDIASLDIVDGRAGVSLFDAEVRTLPLTLDMLERHPEGSQCFVPMAFVPFLVTVALDKGGRPGTPLAFETRAGQGVNIARGTWHGVLTPLHAPGLFAVIDRIGDGPNLEEYWFEEPYHVIR